jgi:hypothetical protein
VPLETLTTSSSDKEFWQAIIQQNTVESSPEFAVYAPNGRQQVHHIIEMNDDGEIIGEEFPWETQGVSR